MTPLSKHHQQTYDAIFQHPIARHLNRRDVSALLHALAEVGEEPNGNLKAVRNGHTLTLHDARDKNVTAAEELMMIRHFLERSESPPAQDPKAPGHILVVINHREAHIFKTEFHGSLPQTIMPFDPHGFGRSLHYVEDDADGKRKPELKTFYEAIARTLYGASEILLFGSATGASSAMQMLLDVLRRDHPDVASRVIGSVALDVRHLSDDQLLARAREFYEARKAPVLQPAEVH